MYFNNMDFEVFTTQNANTPILNERKRVHNKLMLIHESVYPQVKYLDLHHHDRKANIASSYQRQYPPYDYYPWHFIRYGKKDELLKLKFYEQAVLQFGIFEGKDFCVGIHLGDKENSWARLKLKEYDDRKWNLIKSEIEKLKGNNLKWEILDVGEFYLDDNSSENFCKWLLDNDSKGSESFIDFSYDRDNELISTPEKIKCEIVRKIQLLSPLYNAFTVFKQ